MEDVRKLVRIQILVVVLFIVGKSWLRPRVLEADAPAFLDVFVLSLPNFCEAVAGTLLVAAIALVVNRRWLADRFGNMIIYVGATAASAVYVVLQELEIHDLGGRNVYDPWDVAYSVAGLAVAFGILLWLRPTVPSGAS